MGLPNDPLALTSATRCPEEMIRKGTVIDWFGTNYPMMTLLREAGIIDLDFQGTGVRTPGIYNYTDGEATQPGATINPTNQQRVTDTLYDIRFMASQLIVEPTEYKLYNAPGETQVADQELIDNYCMTQRLESMVEMQAYQHGQWNSGSGVSGSSAAGVNTDRHLAMNGFEEIFNNGVDPSPFGNYFTLTGGITRNGVVGQAYNSTPYYCGSLAGQAGSINYSHFLLANARTRHAGSKSSLRVYQLLRMGSHCSCLPATGGHPATRSQGRHGLRLAFG